LVGATRSLLRDEGVEKFHKDPTVGPFSKKWTRGQRLRKNRSFEMEVIKNPVVDVRQGMAWGVPE